MTEITSESLGEALPREMARVRDEVLPAYMEANKMPQANCDFAIASIRIDLNEATRAMAEGDLQSMIVLYQRLRDYRL